MLRIITDTAARAEMARKELNINELIMSPLSIAVAINLGPGTLGLITYRIFSKCGGEPVCSPRADTQVCPHPHLLR
jgi:hypothetical protein